MADTIFGIDEQMFFIIFGILIIALSPFFGMLIFGVSRKWSARMQNRYGPPYIQPWYDFQKLLEKRETTTNPLAQVMVMGYVAFTMAAVTLFAMRADILIIFILLGAGQLFLVMTGYASGSPYSTIGANRQLIQFLSIEPLLLITAVAILMINGTFWIEQWETNQLFLIYPIGLAAIVLAIMVAMQKSPFDISQAHQEIIYGPAIELSGRHYALVTLGHWLEVFVLFGIATMFITLENFILDIIVKIIVAVVIVLIVTLIDNSSARGRWEKLPRVSYYYLLPLLMVNLLVFLIAEREGWIDDLHDIMEFIRGVMM